MFTPFYHYYYNVSYYILKSVSFISRSHDKEERNRDKEHGKKSNDKSARDKDRDKERDKDRKETRVRKDSGSGSLQPTTPSHTRPRDVNGPSPPQRNVNPGTAYAGRHEFSGASDNRTPTTPNLHNRHMGGQMPVDGAGDRWQGGQQPRDR